MNPQTIAFLGVAAGIIVTPGADFTIVVRNALRDRRHGMATAFGVVSGLLLHTTLAALGLAALVTASNTVYEIFRWIGASYLLYLGLRVLIESRKSSSSGVNLADTAGQPGGNSTTAKKALRQGFLTNATNPGAPVLFLTLLPQFIPPGAPVLGRTLVLGALVVALGLTWFPLVALTVDWCGSWLRRPRVSAGIARLSGSALLVLGALIIAH